jgi:hypothetical protein
MASVRRWGALGVLGAALALGAAAPARAQELPALDPAITHVVTGGAWEAAGREGSLRLVVVTHGSDHLISRLYVQWLEVVPDSATPRVVRTERVTAIPDGYWTLGRPRLAHAGGEWRVTVEGADTHFDPPRRGRWEVAIGAPGELLVRSASR